MGTFQNIEDFPSASLQSGKIEMLRHFDPLSLSAVACPSLLSALVSFLNLINKKSPEERVGRAKESERLEQKMPITQISVPCLSLAILLHAKTKISSGDVEKFRLHVYLHRMRNEKI